MFGCGLGTLGAGLYLAFTMPQIRNSSLEKISSYAQRIQDSSIDSRHYLDSIIFEAQTLKEDSVAYENYIEYVAETKREINKKARSSLGMIGLFSAIFIGCLAKIRKERNKPVILGGKEESD